MLSKNVEQKCGAKMWSKNVEQKYGAKMWSKYVEQKCGVKCGAKMWSKNVEQKCGAKMFIALYSIFTLYRICSLKQFIKAFNSNLTNLVQWCLRTN